MKNTLIITIVNMAMFSFNLIGTHLRNSSWFTYKLRWKISIFLSIIGFIGFFILLKLNIKFKMVCFALITPLIFTAIDRLLMFISFKYQNRDFQFNTSFETWLNQHKRGISMWDNFITLISLLIMTGLLIISSVIAL